MNARHLGRLGQIFLYEPLLLGRQVHGWRARGFGPRRSGSLLWLFTICHVLPRASLRGDSRTSGDNESSNINIMLRIVHTVT